MLKLTLSVLFVLLALQATAAKRYDRCSLARELSRLGVPRNDLSAWVCIAKFESEYNTQAVGPPNTDGSQDYGIFQINSLYWCAPPSGAFSHNMCGIRCQDLLVDSVQPSLGCSQKIKNAQGWAAWTMWKKCDGQLPSIDDCF